jgi:hypothetical protein
MGGSFHKEWKPAWAAARVGSPGQESGSHHSWAHDRSSARRLNQPSAPSAQKDVLRRSLCPWSPSTWPGPFSPSSNGGSRLLCPTHQNRWSTFSSNRRYPECEPCSRKSEQQEERPSCAPPQAWEPERMRSRHHAPRHPFCARAWFCSPDGEQLPQGEKVWLLHFAEHLLIERFVIVRHLPPLAHRWQYCPKAQPHILGKMLSLNCSSTIVQSMGLALHVLLCQADAASGQADWLLRPTWE